MRKERLRRRAQTAEHPSLGCAAIVASSMGRRLNGEFAERVERRDLSRPSSARRLQLAAGEAAPPAGGEGWKAAAGSRPGSGHLVAKTGSDQEFGPCARPAPRQIQELSALCRAAKAAITRPSSPDLCAVLRREGWRAGLHVSRRSPERCSCWLRRRRGFALQGLGAKKREAHAPWLD